MLGFILHLIKIMPISDGMFHSVIDPLTIGLIGSGVQLAIGGIQALTAGKKQAEPKYEIPQEVFQATKQAQEMAQTGMPEASRMMALQGAQQAAIFRQRAAGQSRLGQANVATNETLLSRDLLNIASADAQRRQDNQIRALQALMTQAQYKDKAFANQWQSWMNKEQQRRANIGAAGRTGFGAFDNATSLIAMRVLGGTKTTATTPTVATPPSATRFPAVQLPTYSTPTQAQQINALSGIINQPQLPTNMTNTGGSFLFGNPM